jgi:hypothetical protein
LRPIDFVCRPGKRGALKTVSDSLDLPAGSCYRKKVPQERGCVRAVSRNSRWRSSSPPISERFSSSTRGKPLGQVQEVDAGLPNSPEVARFLCGLGLVATVPATPSTLEDYAGRNYGNGIDLPGNEGSVRSPSWFSSEIWYEGRREAAQSGFRALASGVFRPFAWGSHMAVRVCRLLRVLNGFKELRFAYI